jgi:hypothetical protein
MGFQATAHAKQIEASMLQMRNMMQTEYEHERQIQRLLTVINNQRDAQTRLAEEQQALRNRSGKVSLFDSRAAKASISISIFVCITA